MRFLILFLVVKLFGISAIETSKNLQVLNSLDIDTNFIKDPYTQDLYRFYIKRRKQYFLNVLENGYSYIPLIRKEIKKAKIPTNLVFVAMAESYFSSRARSNKKAIGLWQFMPSTARLFHLKIDDYVDERRDPIKSTAAAIKYLSMLKKRMGKWYLAIMSYNCGQARVMEAITRAKLDKYCLTHKCKHNPTIKQYRKAIKNYQYHHAKFQTLYTVYKKVNQLYPHKLNIMDLLRVQPRLHRQYLPKETRRYIRKIVAMSFLLNSAEFVKYQNHYLLNRGNISNLVKVNVPAGTSLQRVARLLGIDYEYLRVHNLHLKYGFTPPTEDSYIYIPYPKLAKFKLTFNHINITKKIVYKVHRGDTLSTIAAKFRIHYHVIKDFNHLTSNFLRVNQKLIIPVRPHIKIPKTIKYKVQKGDNLRYLAHKFHTSLTQIKSANNLSSDMIYQNQILTIPTYVEF
ncbi:MAG: transglycosylase SLT domain-containing protein [Epsilonproteobacteria bacterium]|nr:transglycosylase SLT domain-containing protein [Campylobacterota bacterium]